MYGFINKFRFQNDGFIRNVLNQIFAVDPAANPDNQHFFLASQKNGFFTMADVLGLQKT